MLLYSNYNDYVTFIKPLSARYTVKERQVLLDKAEMVNMNKGCHEELAIKSIHDSTMAWYCITKILKNISKVSQ